MFCCRTVTAWSLENFPIIIKLKGSITVVIFVQHKKIISNQKKTDWQQIVLNEFLTVVNIGKKFLIQNPL